jgi:hypothetical protein
MLSLGVSRFRLSTVDVCFVSFPLDNKQANGLINEGVMVVVTEVLCMGQLK